MLFGIVTVISGGRALFGSDEVRAALGNVVPMVLWFNFAAGFAYVVAGAGLLWQARWSAWLAVGLAAATLVVFALFGWQAANGTAFEMRTVAAMSLRSVFWVVVAVVALRRIR
jgi:hypothetical protein